MGKRYFLIFIFSLLSVFYAFGNNVRIVGVVKAVAASGGKAGIEFTLEWENSWRDDYNHDAVYVVLRYKLLKQSPTVWYPVYLQDSDHSADNGFVVSVAPGHAENKNVGVFISRGQRGNGIARTNVVLRWDISTTNVNGPGLVDGGMLATGEVILACTGIEMVYIPRGAYALGDMVDMTTGSASPRSFYQRDTFIPESYDLVSTRYWTETNPDVVASNPASLAANHMNDLTNGTSNAWVGNDTDGSLLWTIDFGRLSDGTELTSNTQRCVRYIGIESIPGHVPGSWELWGANRDVSGGWGTTPLYTGTSSDWGTSLERVYPPQRAIRIPNESKYRYYRILIPRTALPKGASPVIKSVSMTDSVLSRYLDYTYIVDTTITRLGGVRGLSASNDGEDWPVSVLGSSYPNGYNAFYVMKYEVSQDQYCGFLQMLPPVSQQDYTIGSSLSGVEPRQYVFGPSRTKASWRNGIVVSTRTSTGDTCSFACDLDQETPVSLDGDGMPLACNYLTPFDMLGYASWLGLRPLTELEYERMCRSPYPVVPLALGCAWGSSDVRQPGTLLEGGKTNESVSSGNVNYGNRIGGPLRVGVFARSGGRQESSGSSFWGVQDLSGNLNELYYNANSSGRKYNGSRHGNGELEPLSTLHKSWGWDTTRLSFGLRGGSFRSGMPSDLSVSNRQFSSRHIADNHFRDSTVGFRLGRSCAAGPSLSSILTLENGQSTSSGNVSDTVCSGVDYLLSGNEPPGTYAVSYLWYKSENLGRTWELQRGESGRDLLVRDVRNTGMPDGALHEYWYRRRVIRDNSDGLSRVAKIVVVNSDYTLSRMRDTLDGYGESGGIWVRTKYPTTFRWHYLATGAELSAKSGDTHSSYYLPQRSDFSQDTTRRMYGTKMVMVTIDINHACERSEIIPVDVINVLDKDLMKVRNYGSYRAWGDGTYAPSAEGYRRPKGGYEYRGDIGSGIYRIDPDGRDGLIEPFDVYCDMTTDGGGWTVLRSDFPEDLDHSGTESAIWIYTNITYGNVSEAQILGLRAVSKQGYQYFSKRCYNSLMNSDNYCYWVSYGNIAGHYYDWPNYVNCNPNDNVWRQADGKVTNINLIPIWKYRGDETGQGGEYAKYTFGDVYFK